MTPKFEDAIAIIVKAWEGRKDAPDYPDYDDINTAIGSLEKAVKILGIFKWLFSEDSLKYEGCTFGVEVDEVKLYFKTKDDYKTIKEWLEEKE